MLCSERSQAPDVFPDAQKAPVAEDSSSFDIVRCARQRCLHDGPSQEEQVDDASAADQNSADASGTDASASDDSSELAMQALFGDAVAASQAEQTHVAEDGEGACGPARMQFARRV